MAKTGKCKLCLLEQPLMDKSHIIPAFMFDSLHQKGTQIYKFAPAELLGGNGRITELPSGEYEEGILCSRCDNEIIGGYELYAHKAMYGKEVVDNDHPEFADRITEQGVKFRKCQNLHYKEFKLFLLSILWKASISTRDIFREVNLGPYEDVIREMILNGDPKEDDKFPILIVSWLNDNFTTSDLVGEPGVNKKQKGVRYVFPIAGVTYVFYISPTSLRPDLQEFVLSSKNEASIVYIPDGKAKKLLMTLFGASKY